MHVVYVQKMQTVDPDQAAPSGSTLQLSVWILGIISVSSLNQLYCLRCKRWDHKNKSNWSLAHVNFDFTTMYLDPILINTADLVLDKVTFIDNKILVINYHVQGLEMITYSSFTSLCTELVVILVIISNA